MDNDDTSVKSRKGPNIHQWALMLVSLSIAIFVTGQTSRDFMASVISPKQAAPFDGTALPILKAPKWTSLTTEQYKAVYDSIPSEKFVSLPKYDPEQLRKTTESLGWKLESDLSIRNAKITFSTPYMGNYKLDGIEYAGSHPAVDIKIPSNTPVYSIANGIVDKVANLTTGYGKHIVIRHENVPSLTDPNTKVTLYSSYNHMSELLVVEGDIVTKGQLLGKSGNTGVSTTPHLHFQIDTASAPWHPYWPFTYAESNAAGLSFFEAVNAGLNADKAKAVTINPMLYVQKYLNYPGTSSSSTPTPVVVSTPVAPTTPVVPQTPPVAPVTDSSLPVDTTVVVPVPDNAVTTDTPAVTDETPAVVSDESYASNAAAFLLTSDGAFVEYAAEKITIKAVDVNGDTVTGYKPKDYVYLQVELGGADLPAYLQASDFLNGESTFEITPKGAVGLQIKATDGVLSGVSDIMRSSMFSDLAEDAANYRAISFLRKHDVLGGYPDGTFKPGNVVSRVEALKFILEGANSRLISDAKLPFKDTKVSEWYSDYVATGYSKNVVAGYKDSTFKPEKTVNRVEFLKMLIAAMDVKINPIVTRDLYDDVARDAWYAPYVRYARETNIMEAKGKLFRPEEGMTRAEVAEAIYRMILLKLNDTEAYSSGMTASSSEVNRYFN